MATELCRTIAYESVRRGARSNVHELWAALERVDDLGPRLIVDIGSGPAVWFAWWSMGSAVIGVSHPDDLGQVAAFSRDRLPSAVVGLSGDQRERSTRLRVRDQVAKRLVDVLVLAGIGTEDVMRAAWGMYGPLVRDGGLVLVHGIADRRTPGVGQFWRALIGDGRKELIGRDDPIGYGIMEIHRRGVAGHG